MKTSSTRAGRYVRQPTQYRAFIPAALPPDPSLEMDPEMTSLLSRADQALGRLDGAARILPSPDLFVAMYVRREAVLSSQIEGTQSSLSDVLEFELPRRRRRLPPDVEEVVNYVRAMNYGLDRLESLPLSLRLLREIHEILLADVRGGERQPGEFRSSQNWIAPEGALISDAIFVPPPHQEMNRALGELEQFLHDDHGFPVLIHAGLVHSQFETIHPFLDGNGRIGRLLITFQLCYAKALHKPLLYLSIYLKKHRAEYYDRLMSVRHDGDWEGWIKFFLRGVCEASETATATARAIVDMRENHRELVQSSHSSPNAPRLLDVLFESPLLDVNSAMRSLEVSYGTANSLLEQFSQIGLVREITGGQRYRVFRYDQYLALFEDGDSDGT